MRALRWAARLAVVVTVVTLMAPAAGAQPGASSGGSTGATDTASAEQARAQLGESTAAMLAAVAALRAAQDQLPAARAAVAHYQRQLRHARAEAQAAAVRRAAAETTFFGAMRAQEQASAAVEQQRAEISQLARQAYIDGPIEMAALLTAGSPTEFTQRLVSVDSVMTAQRSALANLAAAGSLAQQRTDRLQTVQTESADADRTARDRLASVASLEAQARYAVQALDAVVRARDAALEAARAAVAEDERRFAALQSEADALAADLAARAEAALGADAGSPVPPVAGTLQRPVLGPVSSPYGMRVHPITGVYKLHTGTDFSAPCGTPIRAAGAGQVVSAGWSTGYGWRVVVAHGVVAGGYLGTTYNHQSSLAVRPGQPVQAGQVIGYVGSTGYSTGCHLHFELVVNGGYVDPVPWL